VHIVEQGTCTVVGEDHVRRIPSRRLYIYHTE